MSLLNYSMYACYFVNGKQLKELRTLFSEMLCMQLRKAIPIPEKKPMQLDDVCS